MNRRFLGRLLGAAAIAVTGLGVAPQSVQAFPERPVTVVVAWPAGGGHDTVTRLVTEFLEQELGTSVVVTNVPGAAGATGVRQVEEAEADGYTLGVLGLHATAQSYMNENATALENLEPLALINI